MTCFQCILLSFFNSSSVSIFILSFNRSIHPISTAFSITTKPSRKKASIDSSMLRGVRLPVSLSSSDSLTTNGPSGRMDIFVFCFGERLSGSGLLLTMTKDAKQTTKLWSEVTMPTRRLARDPRLYPAGTA
jgi:hypothetical protein